MGCIHMLCEGFEMLDFIMSASEYSMEHKTSILSHDLSRLPDYLARPFFSDHYNIRGSRHPILLAACKSEGIVAKDRDFLCSNDEFFTIVAGSNGVVPHYSPREMTDLYVEWQDYVY